MTKVLSFIHLSDIHFNKYCGDPYDIDSELRNAMISDLKKYAKQQLTSICGILVCGDLAFSGQENEYQKAKEFLTEVIEIFDISFKDVFCVAGNHDVDQGVIKRSRIIEHLQDTLVDVDNKNPDSLDEEIRTIQNDEFVKGILYEPLRNYNKSVTEMACKYSVDKPNWASNIEIDEKYVLSIYGMNSVLTSSHKDHLDERGQKTNVSERKMTINRKQIPEPRDNVIYMSLCHHPPECWNNQKLQEFMDARVMIQLYGHKHIQKIEEGNNCIKISSGALQPERGEHWYPRYNWIQMYIENNELIVKIYPRIFEEKRGVFICDGDSCDDGQECKQISLKIKNEVGNHLDGIKQNENKMDLEVRTTNSITKEIVYRFTILSEHDKKSILGNYERINYKISEDIDKLLKQLQDNNLENNFLERIKNHK